MANEKVTIGIDADLTKVGIVTVDHATGELFRAVRVSAGKSHFGLKRSINIVDNVIEELAICKEQYDIGVVMMEDFGVNIMIMKQSEKAALMGMIFWFLIKNKFPLFRYYSTKKSKNRTITSERFVLPTQLKKFIFGRGNVTTKGKSSTLLLDIYKMTGYDFPDDDIADAFMLAQAGRFFLRNLGDPDGVRALPIIRHDTKSVKPVVKSFYLDDKRFSVIQEWIKNQLHPKPDMLTIGGQDAQA